MPICAVGAAAAADSSHTRCFVHSRAVGIAPIVVRQIARNLRAGKRAGGGDVASGAELDPAAAARYAESAYRSLVERSGLGPKELRGARVLEVGPGDNLALALRLYA